MASPRIQYNSAFCLWTAGTIEALIEAVNTAIQTLDFLFSYVKMLIKKISSFIQTYIQTVVANIIYLIEQLLEIPDVDTKKLSFTTEFCNLLNKCQGVSDLIMFGDITERLDNQPPKYDGTGWKAIMNSIGYPDRINPTDDVAKQAYRKKIYDALVKDQNAVELYNEATKAFDENEDPDVLKFVNLSLWKDIICDNGLKKLLEYLLANIDELEYSPTKMVDTLLQQIIAFQNRMMDKIDKVYNMIYKSEAWKTIEDIMKKLAMFSTCATEICNFSSTIVNFFKDAEKRHGVKYSKKNNCVFWVSGGVSKLTDGLEALDSKMSSILNKINNSTNAELKKSARKFSNEYSLKSLSTKLTGG